MSAYADGCDVVADLVIEGAPPFVCVAGTYVSSGAATGPACAPFFWLNTHPGYKQALKLATDQGCEVAVRVGPDTWRIVVRNADAAVREAQRRKTHAERTFRALNTMEGMLWLMRRLAQ